MNAQLRAEFMRLNTPGKREEMMKALIECAGDAPAFRVCESPLFLTPEFLDQCVRGANDLLAQVQTCEFQAYRQTAIPSGQEVPGMDDHPQFVQIDFAITDAGPKLIELQGFPSVYAYQVALDRACRTANLVPEGLSAYLGGLDEFGVIEGLRKLVLNGEDAEHVVLLELHPEKQRTRVDFSATKNLIGIDTVCLTQVKKSGRSLFRIKDGKETRIKRIYNRVIFDELERKNLDLEFHPTDEVDITWAGHPNWFHALSKHTLPFLKGECVPECYRVSDTREIPRDLENWVLKPLYSFAGAGVKVNVRASDLATVQDPENWLLQRKVTYSDCIETPAGLRKAEVRIMALWDQAPVLGMILVRVSSTGMSGVGANLDEEWVGATLAYFPVK